jgi:methylglyoxal synthase
MEPTKNMALVAHDNRKRDLVEWAEWNYDKLLHHNLICTGTTGNLLEETLRNKRVSETGDDAHKVIRKLKSGPLGGDQQLGAMISEGEVDVLIFF